MEKMILYISSNYKDILATVLVNIKILLSFSLFYGLGGMTIYSLIISRISGLSLYDCVRKSPVVLRVLFGFKYPDLKLYDLKEARMLFINTIISLFHSNLFWIDERNIQLVNATYESKDGIVKLTDLNLKRNEIEIVYEIESSNKNFKLVKDKKINKLKLDDKDFGCNMDTEHNKILIKCKGYYIFNQTKLVFESKIWRKENFEIKIDPSHFFDVQNQYDIKELIDICKWFCQLCLGLCFVLILLPFMQNNLKKIPAIIIINIIVFRLIFSFAGRLFDIFRENGCKE